jgi:tetratricopeptide (TPR) repeat protein
MGNYHLLTLISYAVEYELAGNNAAVFHATNVFLHVLNLILVFVFVVKLTQKNNYAFIVALLFSIHPMHLESVAWISARKDLLFSLFLLLGLISYLNYTQTKRKLFYVLLSVSFIFSLLSKGMAIIFPPILVLIDVFQNQKLKRKILLEKIPFFFVAIAFLFLGIVAQQSNGAMHRLEDILHIKSLFIGSYGFSMYILKLLVPFKLSAFHPYPFSFIQNMPFYFYFTFVTVIFYGYLLVKTYKRFPLLFFGLSFFVVSVFPVLQILPFGEALFSERYTYISYIGLFLVAGFLFEKTYSFLSRKNKLLKNIFVQLVVFYVFILGFITHQRIAVWENSKTLWTDVIQKYPTDYFAYGNRANAEPNPEKAIDDYTKCIELNPDFFEAYNNRGLKYLDVNEYEKAISDFNQTLIINPNYPKSYVNLGLAHFNLNQFDKAELVFNRAVELDPKSELFFLTGVLFIINLTAWKMLVLILTERYKLIQMFTSFMKSAQKFC